MDILVLRPLIIAIFEYTFAGLSLKYGKFYPKLGAAFFILLGTYQLGEFLLFTTEYDSFSVNLSFFSTTLLPPLGVLFAQQITKKQFGYVLFQILGLIFAFGAVLNPTIFSSTDECYCFAKYAVEGKEDWHDEFSTAWATYYAVTLIYGMALAGFYAIKSKSKKDKSTYVHLFITYTLFFPTSYFLVKITNWDPGYLPSIMCALAFFGAMVMFKQVIKPKS